MSLRSDPPEKRAETGVLRRLAEGRGREFRESREAADENSRFERLILMLR